VDSSISLCSSLFSVSSSGLEAAMSANSINLMLTQRSLSDLLSGMSCLLKLEDYAALLFRPLIELHAVRLEQIDYGLPL
jgi:hypothetical protein